MTGRPQAIASMVARLCRSASEGIINTSDRRRNPSRSASRTYPRNVTRSSIRSCFQQHIDTLLIVQAVGVQHERASRRQVVALQEGLITLAGSELLQVDT